MNWLAKKNINNEIVQELLKKPLETNQFTNNGPNVKKLEKYIKEKFQIQDSKCVIMVTNGSVALHALSSGIEYMINKKINWATQSFTFPPSAQSNLRDVTILDIDKDGGINLDLVKNNIDGLIVTNIFGNIVDIEKYENYCEKNNKFLIFDNAATSYTFYKGKNCLNYGTGCTISFHHTKPFGFGEGGAIIVDKKYENNIRCLNNFGIGLTNKYWVSQGNNNKMSEISAIYILQYLMTNLDNIITKHNILYNYFKNQIKKYNISHFKLFSSFHDNIIVPSCFCIIFDNYDESIRNKLLKNNIECRKYYNPLDNTKNSNELYNNILCISCNIDINENDINKIIKLLI